MWYIITAVLILAADIITKVFAEASIAKTATIPIIRDVFHLTYVENRGMAFGMMSGGRIIFVAGTILILAVMCVILIKTPAEKKNFWLKAGSVCVMSGAVGNLIERIFKGYVVDFLDFRIIDFPVFNIADIAVCVGAAMLVIYFIRAED